MAALPGCQAADPCKLAQVSALACPELLQKLSAHLTAVGDDLDRGRHSADLRATVAPALSQQELQAFDRLCGRLHTIASAAKAKVRLCPSSLSLVKHPMVP